MCVILTVLLVGCVIMPVFTVVLSTAGCANGDCVQQVSVCNDMARLSHVSCTTTHEAQIYYTGVHRIWSEGCLYVRMSVECVCVKCPSILPCVLNVCRGSMGVVVFTE